MTEAKRAKLRAEMSRMIAGYIEQGERITTGQICDMMLEGYPELIEDAQRQLMRASLSQMARTLLKEANKKEQEDIQVSLFGNREVGLTIPKCIAVPSDDDSREIIWSSIMTATLAEIDAYADFLRRGAAADLAKARKLSTFRDFVAEMASSDDLDTPIEELVAGLREAASEA